MRVEKMNNINFKLPRPHKTQQQVLDAFKTTRFITMCCGRRWGKSLISKVISITQGLKQKKHIYYITPQFRLSKKFFKEICNMLPADIYTANKSDLIIEFISGGTISFFSGENLDAPRGGECDILIIDEASYIADLEYGWKNALRPLLLKTKGKALFISTPRGKDFFFELCGIKNKNWKHFQFTSYDNPFVDPEEIEEAKLDSTPEEFAQEYLAVAGANKSAIVSMDVITRNTITELSKDPTVIFGIDVASEVDYTSITGLDANGRMTYHEHFQIADWFFTEEAIKRLPAEVLKVMDITGAGKVVFNNCVNAGVYNLQGYVFTAQSKPILIKEMIIALQRDKLKFNQVTADELSTFEYKLHQGGHVTYNAISGRHDDTCISLALASKYLELGRTATPEEFMNRFSW